MEVHKKLHAVCGGTFAYLNGIIYVAVAAAIAVSVGIKGVVPYADADIVDAVFAENFIDILFRTVIVIIFHAALFKGRHAGGIHAHDEVFGQVLHLFHIESIGCGHRHSGAFLRLGRLPRRRGASAAGAEKHKCGESQSKHLFLHDSLLTE